VLRNTVLNPMHPESGGTLDGDWRDLGHILSRRSGKNRCGVARVASPERFTTSGEAR
jgi:hypothetical protein